MNPHVLVTGGAGFIGTHLVRRLAARGYPVTVLDNERTGSLARLKARLPDGASVELVRGDVRNAETVRKLMVPDGFVVHLAAQVSVVESMERPLETLDINVAGTATLLEEARRSGIRRLVFASSCAVYGDAPSPPFDEDDPATPTSTYGLSKLLGEHLCRFYARGFDLDTVVLRFFNVYGPYQAHDSPYASVVPNFMKAAALNRPMTIYGSGEQTRDFIYVEDLVRMLELALVREGLRGRIVNLGTGVPVSVNSLAQKVQEACGVQVPVRYDPPRPGEMMHAHARIHRLRRWLGWNPEDFTAMSRALARTWAWYRRDLAAS